MVLLKSTKAITKGADQEDQDGTKKSTSNISQTDFDLRLDREVFTKRLSNGLEEFATLGPFKHERDTCINNLKLNLNVSSTKADYIRSTKANRDQHVWASKASEEDRVQRSFKDKYDRGSLDNVSRIPWDDGNSDEQSTLRRTRSFAISRENLFYSLNYIETAENHRGRRPQLIPRAKLVEKSFIKDTRYESLRVESLPQTTKKVPQKPQEIPPDYSPLPRSSSHRNFSVNENICDSLPTYTDRTCSPFTENKEDISLDLDTKISDNSRNRKSLEDLTGLSLPNYYPDSDLTDNISVTDNQSTISQGKSKYISLDNLPWDLTEQPESISYDENIVLTKKTERLYAKPRTIRGPTPYHNFDYDKLPQFNPDITKEAEKNSDPSNEQQSSIEFETNTNCDEIKLNIENIVRKDESDKESLQQEKDTYYSVNEIIDKLKTKTEVVPICTEKPLKPARAKPIGKPDIDVKSSPDVKTVSVSAGETANKHSDNQIKTLIEVCTAKDSENPSDFRSIVTVDTGKSDATEEAKSHSHNYLKEFLETQKGSKKPLQSFIAKKFSNLTRRNSKSNLVSNQFYSLPDITASKNLHKCEKIDRKLRKCVKLEQVPERVTENRFIVNIGNHFDITAKGNIPLDFQVKIAKVPKKNKKQGQKKDNDKEFKEAVRNINSTLLNNGFSIDLNNNNVQETGISKATEEMDPETQEKVDNMRNYWTKIAGNTSNSEKCDDEKEPDCKIAEIQTKVNNVKKKFEPPTETNDGREKAPNIVQQAKKIFESKTTCEKVERISPIIKETCNYFERNRPKRHSSTCYESLCPSSVELVTKNEDNSNNMPTNGNKITTAENIKPKKPLAKSNSISIPEFDHVRYKVIKPELFNKKFLANCETEAQFDGLMQYLQDYSFQELLIDNNIVIIEPIRSKVQHQKPPKAQTKNSQSSNGITTMPKLNGESEFDDVKQGIRKHFFYHPIRVNKEVNDDELPNPDVVRQARQFFEKAMVKSQSTEEIGTEKERYREINADPDKDKCSTSSSNSILSEDDEQENMYDSLDNDCCTEYVSEDILEKIREYGTTVTYYGGRVVKQHKGQPTLTKIIMEEIKNNEKRCMECSSCRRRSVDKTLSEVNKEYQGIKFKLVKSNSCSSRLELVGAANRKDIKKKINLRKNNKVTNEEKNNYINETNNNEIKERSNILKKRQEIRDKNAINENIKLSNKLTNQPRIIGEEKKVPDNNKYVQWSEIKKEQTFTAINFNDKGEKQIRNYEYHEKVTPSKRPCDMEFEPYEVA